MNNPGKIADELAKVYAEPALVPESPWLAEGKTPARPEFTFSPRGDKPTLNVKAAKGTRFVVVRALTGDAWTTSVHGVAEDGTATITLNPAKRFVLTALDRTARESEPVELK
jgi:hypothetical protein